MSKSLNNFFTVRDILEKYNPEVLRFLMLSGHYRTQLNFSTELLDSAVSSMERLYNAINNLQHLYDNSPYNSLKSGEENYINTLESYRNKFIEKMDDDFNTADGISVIFDLVKDINTNITADASKELIETAVKLIRQLGEPLGILQENEKADLEEEIEALIERRQQARKDKNWALADEIRDDLKARGIILEDTPQGVRWKLEK